MKTREEYMCQPMTEGNAYRLTANISVKTATLRVDSANHISPEC